MITAASPADTPEAFRPPAGHPRFEHIDALRAIAALGVLTTHAAAEAQVKTASWAGIALRLNVGVTIFFLISGFLLYRPMVAARIGAPPRTTRNYFRARLLRIGPAYWVALTLLAIWPGLVGVFSHDAPVYYGLLQIYQPDTFLGGLAAAWTLCVELTFYLGLPLWATLWGRLTRRIGFEAATRAEGVALVIAALLAVSWHTIIQYETDRDYLANNLLGLFDWFALGMGLALLSVRNEWRPTRTAAALRAHPGAWWIAALVAYLVTVFGLGLPRFPTFPPPPDMTIGQIAAEHISYGVVALCLMVPAAFPGDRRGWPRVVMTWPPLAWLGLISYGIFLWHDRFIYFLADHGALRLIDGMPFVSMLLTTLAVAIPLGAASWYLVERPALRFKRQRRAGPA